LRSRSNGCARAQQVTAKGIGNIEGQTLEGPLLGRSRVIGGAKAEAAVFGLLPGLIGLMEESGRGVLEGAEGLNSLRVGQTVFG
jgi:hypothetical protein